jgi:hypothetical protein
VWLSVEVAWTEHVGGVLAGPAPGFAAKQHGPENGHFRLDVVGWRECRGSGTWGMPIAGYFGCSGR